LTDWDGPTTLKENPMDTLQAAYLVSVAVHVALWLYGHLKGP